MGFVPCGQVAGEGVCAGDRLYFPPLDDRALSQIVGGASAFIRKQAMNDPTQTIFNSLFILLGVFGGYYLNSVKDAIKALQATDQILITKLQAIEVLVAGTYIKREEFETMARALFTKLDSIDAKIDTKTDRAMCMAVHSREHQ